MVIERLLALGLVLAVGCGGAPTGPTSTGPVHHGDADADPDVAILPSADPGQSLSSRMRFAWLLVEEALDVEAPRPPINADASTVFRWSETTLAHWLEVKAHAVESARLELDEAAEEGLHQRIMAGALVGLIYEDVARALDSVPVPVELEAEPDIAEMFRDIRDFNASPYREHARNAYLACAANAANPGPLRHWSRFCAERAERLPPQRNAPFLDEGTVVSVSYQP